MTERTIQECGLVKKAIKVGMPEPEIEEGRCMGYAWVFGDEPCQICKECKINTAYEGGIAVESKNMFQEVAKVSDALQNVSDALQSVSSTLDYILEPIMCMSEDRLERKIKELKQSDGEGWAIGEMMERIKWLII